MAFALLLLAATVSQAQTLNLQQFVLLSGSAGCTGCSVQVGPSSRINSGAVGSFGLIKTSGNPTIAGSLHSLGTIDLSNETKIGGRITVGNPNPASPVPSGTLLQVGSNGTITGNLDVRGNAVIGNTVLSGTLTQPANTTYSGPLPAGGRVIGTPYIPNLPQLPLVSNLSLPSNAAGTQPVSSTRSITPGGWGRMQLNGGRTITFQGPGLYRIESIRNSGSVNTFIFDFDNQVGNIRLLIHGDADMGKMVIIIRGGGSPSRVFAEVRGSGSTTSTGAAWNIASGSSSSTDAQWQGTIYAPSGDIRVGSGSSGSKVIGSMFSARNIIIESGVVLEHAPYTGCAPDVNAGADQTIDCDHPTARLSGSSSTAGALYQWSALEGGQILSGATSASPEVNAAGKYVLQVTNPACGYTATDTVIVQNVPCVLPFYPPAPAGKVNLLIGSELNSLFLNFGRVTDEGKTIFQLQGDKVLIDVIAVQGEYQNLLALLQTPEYGMTGIISNGPSSRIITGFYPIANLQKLNLLAARVRYSRPVYPPLNNGGIATSQGDSAMRSNFVRNGFGVTGSGFKIGVLSDSYNTKPGNPAATDQSNGDLPPIVDILKEYPFGERSDEGRAMMQILHDVAPGAELAFRTGFLTPGDFALGIHELAAAQCKIIVDDLTYVTEPFFTNGVVSNAIQAVSGQGVHYVTSAGNFGGKSYEGIFQPSAPPGTITGKAHNFGGGDILQSAAVKGTVLKPGVYTIVMQWVDDIYSLNSSTTGTQNDLDIYLTDNNGNALFGFNRNNVGGDPIEVLPFVVTANTNINIMVVNASAPANQTSSSIRFKYVVFRGDIAFNEHMADSSTIIGQANTPEAITVGAALYRNTPAYNVPLPTIMSFSSVGGTTYLGSPAQKPDLVGPNGGNTTVNFSSLDLEGDGLPNFYGTSAAAPHVAAGVALILEARQKFYNGALSPVQMKQLLKATAIDMGAPGFDLISGAGFINVDSAVRTMANPTPELTGLALADSSIQPGAAPVGIIIRGNYLSGDTKILLGNTELQTTIINSQQATATLPVFNGVDSIFAITPGKSLLQTDGGISNGIAITGVSKKAVRIVADNKSKRYGEQLPDFTASVFVDDVPLASTELTLADLGLENLQFRTVANAASPANQFYAIRVTRTFNAELEADAILLSKYNYDSVPGRLTVQRLPVVVTPGTQTIQYGEVLAPVTFSYQFDASRIADAASINSLLKASHDNFMPGNALAVLQGFQLPQSDGSFLSQSDLANLSMITSFQALKNSRKMMVENNRYVPFSPGANELNAFYLVDVSAASFFEYKNSPSTSALVSAYPGASPKAILSQSALAQGAAQIFSNNRLLQMVNGDLAPMINSLSRSLAPMINNRLVQMVNARLLQYINNEYVEVPGSEPVQILNNRLTQFVNGSVVELSNGATAELYGGRLVQMVNNRLNPMINGVPVPVIDAANVVFQNGIYYETESGGLTPIANNRLVQMVNGTYVEMQNGMLAPIANRLNPMVNQSLVQMVNNRLVQYVNSNTLGQAPGSKTGVIVDEGDITVQEGWLGAMMGVNMITGLDAGTQTLVPGLIVNDNFEFTYAPATINILPQTITLRAKDTTKLYGESLVLNEQGFTVTSGTLAPGETITQVTLASAGTGAGANAGTYPITISDPVGAAGTNLSNYAFRFENGTLNVGARAITLLADNQTKIYGNTASLSQTAYTVVSGSFVAGQGITGVNLTSTGSAAGAAVAQYPIGITGVLAGAGTNVNNYSFTFQNGTLTVQPRAITLKANDATKPYGESMVLASNAFSLTSGSFAEGEGITGVTLASNGTTQLAPLGTYPIQISNPVPAAGTLLSNYTITLVPGTLTVQVNPCLLTHSPFNNFGSTSNPNTATSLWLNITVKVSGQLTAIGDYLLYKAGTVTLNNIVSTPSVVNAPVPNGKIEVANVSAPVTSFNAATNTWTTLIPPGYSTTSDIFITGAIINSSTGFAKRNGSNSVVNGIFTSNRTYRDQWAYGMAAYQPQFTYAMIQQPGQVVSVNGSYKAGTPLPVINRLVNGGSGGGGNNYTGSSSSMDNFTACIETPAAVTRMSATPPPVASAMEVKEPLALTGGVELQPNPATGSVIISFVPFADGQSTLSIVSSNGSIQYQAVNGKTLKGQQVRQRIDVSALTAGIYLVRYVNGGQVITKKMIIMR